MSWWGYLIFGFLSLFLSAISAFLWMINPFTEVFLLLAAPPLRLLGYHSPVESWSGLASAMLVGFFWPFTLAPLHWLSFRRLRWKKWAYAGLLLLTNVIIAVLVLLAREGC